MVTNAAGTGRWQLGLLSEQSVQCSQVRVSSESDGLSAVASLRFTRRLRAAICSYFESYPARSSLLTALPDALPCQVRPAGASLAHWNASSDFALHFFFLLAALLPRTGSGWLRCDDCTTLRSYFFFSFFGTCHPRQKNRRQSSGLLFWSPTWASLILSSAGPLLPFLFSVFFSRFYPHSIILPCTPCLAAQRQRLCRPPSPIHQLHQRCLRSIGQKTSPISIPCFSFPCTF